MVALPTCPLNTRGILHMNDLWKRSALETARLVRDRKVSAMEVTRSALERLDSVNASINAVVATFHDEALDAANHVDVRIANGGSPGILAGVPVTVKMNIDQSGHATTNGVRIQKDLIATSDHPVVSNLRKAGAVIIGRTNTPAFSLRWFTRNSLHGHTLNPRTSDITPGGSSGGAAAAVASGIGAIAHGTDIGGSIRYPAYACGVHGLRPTLGRIPAWNASGPDRHIGAQLMAVSGPIARSMADIELGLEAMSAMDIRDPWWTPVSKELPAVPRKAALTINPDGMTGDAAVESALKDAALRLESAGWVVEEVSCPGFREPANLQMLFWMSEYQFGGADAIAREADPDAMFVYEQLVKRSPVLNLTTFLEACQRRVGLIREWQQFLADYPVLICPVSAELPFPDQLDVQSETAFNRVFEAQLTQLGLPLLGLPGLTVSTGLCENIPVGVQLIGGKYREDVLIAAGKDIESQGTPACPIDPNI